MTGFAKKKMKKKRQKTIEFCGAMDKDHINRYITLSPANRVEAGGSTSKKG